jgi:hypothetical protein
VDRPSQPRVLPRSVHALQRVVLGLRVDLRKRHATWQWDFTTRHGRHELQASQQWQKLEGVWP